MDDVEKFVKEKLNNYQKDDIEFLKSQWQDWIKQNNFEKIQKKTGANLQVVYNVLD